jgi:hypothetical protein
MHPELLVQRMRRAQRLRLGHHLGVAAQRQPGRQAHLQPGQPRFGQLLHLGREQAAVANSPYGSPRDSPNASTRCSSACRGAPSSRA